MPEVQIVNRGRPLGGPIHQWVHFRLIPNGVAFLVKLLGSTFRTSVQGRDPVEALLRQDQRIILCFYHCRLMAMYLAYLFPWRLRDDQRVRLAILSSDSKDGERSAAIWRWFGVRAVRGTAGERGAQTLVRMIQSVKAHWDLAITVDGPRGPARTVKGGALAVSRRTGAWIVPVSVGYGWCWRLPTWDRLVLPLPFTPAAVRYGEPFRVERAEDEPDATERLHHALEALEDWAETVRP